MTDEDSNANAPEPPPLERLVARYLDGTASEDEVAKLDALLLADADARRALLRAADQDAALRDLLAREAPLPRTRTRSTRRATASRRSSPSLALAAIACALTALVVFFFTRGHETPAPTPSPSPSPSAARASPSPSAPSPSPAMPASPSPSPESSAEPSPSPDAPSPSPEVTPGPEIVVQASPVPSPSAKDASRDKATLEVVKVEGTLEIKENATWRAIAPAPSDEKPFTWSEGKSVRVARGAGRVTLATGERVALKAGTELSVAEREPRAIRLESGEVFCQVPRREGERFTVKTAEGEARVVGTDFGVRRSSHTTVVSVLSGKVELAGSKAVLAIGANEAGELGESAQPVSRKIDLERLAWRFELDAGLPPGARVLYEDDFAQERGWTGARYGPAPGLRPRDQALEARAAPNRGEGFFAEAISPKLAPIAIGAHTYLRFRYLAQGFAPQDHLKLQLKPADESNYGGFLMGVARDSWETMTVRLTGAAFVNDKSKRLASGDKLCSLVWLCRTNAANAPEKARFYLASVVVFEAQGVIASEPLKDDPK